MDLEKHHELMWIKESVRVATKKEKDPLNFTPPRLTLTSHQLMFHFALVLGDTVSSVDDCFGFLLLKAERLWYTDKCRFPD